MFYVYVLQNPKGELYIGYTIDLVRRIKEHNQGKNFSTKQSRNWELIYYEASLHEHDTKRRERYLKTSQGMRLLKRRLKEFLYAQSSTTRYGDTA